MGADHRLIAPQREIQSVEVIAPPWLKPHTGESLASYASRQAASLDTSIPFYLAGLSFGGMVACEAAQYGNPNLRGLILISTCRSNRGIPPTSRWAGRIIAPLLPLAVIRAGKWLVPMTRKKFGIVTPQQGVLFDDMLRDSDPAFLKWSLQALLTWRGPQRPITVPVLQVHGEKDRVLPSRLATPDHIISGAGHVMNVTHAEELNRLIADWIQAREAPMQAVQPSQPLQ